MTCSLEKCNGHGKEGRIKCIKNVQNPPLMKKQAIQMKQTRHSYGSYVVQLIRLGFQSTKRVCRLYTCFCFPVKIILVFMNTEG